MKRVLSLLAVVLVLLQLGCSQMGGSQMYSAGGRHSGVVVLDIGHFIGADGACTPGLVNGKRLTECTWWYEYVYYTKKVIENAGYTCIVTNRGNKPTTEPLASFGWDSGCGSTRSLPRTAA